MFVARYNFMNLQGICLLNSHLALLSKMTGINRYAVHIVFLTVLMKNVAFLK